MALTKRCEDILEVLTKEDGPVSGSSLSKQFGVSRQIIVQDIGKLKDEGYAVIATAKGYIIDPSQTVEKVFKVFHNVEDTGKELELIVSLGGTVKDVFIYHKVYGEIRGKLGIRTKKDVDDFMEGIKSGKSTPLMTATSGFHYHTVAARDEYTMELVEKALKDYGFLAELTEYEPDKVKVK